MICFSRIRCLVAVLVLLLSGTAWATYGVRIGDLNRSPQPPNPVRVWGTVVGNSPPALWDGMALAPLVGVTASPGDHIMVTGDWDGAYLRASKSTAAVEVETLHMGYNSAYPDLTDALRLSTRIGCVWWSKEKDYHNPENDCPMPYAYHDGYFDTPGFTPAQLAARWNQILNGGGDPWILSRMPGGANFPKDPTIIVLDEITGKQSDANGGQHLLEALRIYCSSYGTRDDIMAYLSPGVSRTSSPANYSSVITAAIHYLRRVCLEVYCSHEAYVTGSNESGFNANLQKGDVYLNGMLGNPIRRWANAGVPASRIMPILAVSNKMDARGSTTKPFYKFLNRQFYWLANGRYGDSLTGDASIITALRGGVGTYSWSPGTDPSGWVVSTTETTRDTYIEKYIMWYCVGGNKKAHADGIDAN